MNKLKTMIMAGAALFGAAQTWGATVSCKTWAEVSTALVKGNSVKLTDDIINANSQITVDTALDVTFDLNGHSVRKVYDSRLFRFAAGSKLTIKDSGGNGRFYSDGTACIYGGGLAYVLEAGSRIILESGTIEGYSSTDPTGGGAIEVGTGATFEMNGGEIRNCSATNGGGAIYSYGTGAVVMNGGTIKSCSADAKGGAVYVSGSFTMNGGMITNCQTTATSGDYVGGGAFYINSGTATINGGVIANNYGSTHGGVFYMHGGTVEIYGGTFTGNTALKNGRIFHQDCTGATKGTVTIYGGYFGDHGTVSSNPVPIRCYNGNLNVYGGVFAVQPSTMISVESGKGALSWGDYSENAIGDNWVVGKSVAQASGELTGGTYTFCPTNAEYVAAGVAVAPWVDMTKDETVDPKTWTLADNTEATDVGTSAKARMKDGVCWITGTGATSNDKPIDSQWASVKEVRITDGVTGIGTYFFDRFYNLTNVTVAASCTSLGAGAFYRCFSLEQVTFEGAMPTTIGDNALVITAGIKMVDDNPVVYAVPNVTVNGKSMTLKGKVNLTDAEWQTVTSGEEGNYHFFKFVAGD